MGQVREITGEILKCAFIVHSALGPGLLESVYQECLYYELIQAGLRVEKEKPIPVVYKGIEFPVGFRVDLLVEEQVIVELKAVKNIDDIHLAQLLTYLKLSGCPVRLLINFNVRSLKDGIKRVVV